MKAFQIISPLHTALKEIDAPACRAGEVLLRIRYVGFCGSDLNTYLGRNPMVRMPVIPGHEVGATIEAVGTDVPDFLCPGTACHRQSLHELRQVRRLPERTCQCL